MKTTQSFIILSLLSCTNISYADNWWDKVKDNTQNKIDTIKNKSTRSEPSTSDINMAFKQALNKSSDIVVSKLGSTDGFYKDPVAHIPLPKNLNRAKKLLKKAGKSKYAENLELKLNRAAEAATPKVKKIFKKSIQDLSFSDIRRIYKGPDDSATQYFKSKMTPSLKSEIKPIIKSSLSSVGAVNAYNKLIKKYNNFPFTKDIQPDITEHVIDKTISGIFYYIAKEESAIRNDPVKQSTELLKKVFGKN